MGEMNEQVHRLLLEQRKTLSLGGVQDVKSFDENEVLRCSYHPRKRAACGPPGAGKGRGGYRRQHRQPGLYGTWAAAEEGVCACAAVPVKMSAYVTRELILLACSIWQGAVLGFWYDLIKTARKLIRHSHAAVSAEDLCYWIAAALYLFVRIYGENSGILRGYLFGGILGGAALYHASFGRFLPELLAKGIKKAGRILAFPGKWLVKSMKKQRKRLKFHGKNGKM